MHLSREEYVEQAYFFRSLGERLPDGNPLQDLLRQSRDEVLATTRLPDAIGFLLTEIRHSGQITSAMQKLSHYFTAFQTYLISEAEAERGRFDMRMAVEILHREAAYRGDEPSVPGVFLFQFETLCRNRLSYDRGLKAISEDSLFDEHWREWILEVRKQIGILQFADMVYVRSKHYHTQQKRKRGGHLDDLPLALFGEAEGRIALANRTKDPLYFFAALQRHLNYPPVPRPKPRDETRDLIPQMMRRLERLETRLKMMEDEQRTGVIDLSQFIKRPDPPKANTDSPD